MVDVISQKQRFFDVWAPGYDWLFPSVFYQAIHKRLLDYVQLSAQPNVLDLGCGTGQLLDRLAAHFPSLCGTGLDLSAEMLHQARRNNRHRPRLIYQHGNAESLPFANGQFEAVFNTISFLHYPQPERVLAEVQRVLCPGGRFYLADPIAPFQLRLQQWGFSPNNVRLYDRAAREQLGRQVDLQCVAHHALFPPTVLTIFETHEPQNLDRMR